MRTQPHNTISRFRSLTQLLGALCLCLGAHALQAATLQSASGESFEGTIRCTTGSRVFLETADRNVAILKKSELAVEGQQFVAGWEEANQDWAQVPVKFDRVPELNFRVQPDREAIGEASNQIVMIALLLNENGSVHGAFVRDSTDSRLNAPTVEAVSRWKFTPAEIASKPTRGVLSVPVQF